MTLMKLRLGFLFTDLLDISEYIWWSLRSRFLFLDMAKRWRKVICVIKFKAIQPQLKYKTRHLLKPKTN